jgi:hypothetical protein
LFVWCVKTGCVDRYIHTILVMWVVGMEGGCMHAEVWWVSDLKGGGYPPGVLRVVGRVARRSMCVCGVFVHGCCRICSLQAASAPVFGKQRDNAGSPFGEPRREDDRSASLESTGRCCC